MKTRTRAELYLFATTFIWGSTFVVARSLVDTVSSSLYILLRFGVGALFFVALFSRSLKSISATTWKKGFLLGAMLGIGIVVQNYGIYSTTASKSAFITGLMVIFTPVAQMVIERRMPRPGNVTGIVVVTAGLYLLTSPGGSALNTGDLVVLASAFIFGVFIVCMDIFSKGEDPIQLSFVQIVSTAAIAAACVPFESARCTLSWGDGALVLLMAFFATVVTTYTQTRYQKETTPTRAVIIYTIEPVIAATLAYFALGEVLGVSEVFGAFLIILGILISELSDQVSDLFNRAEAQAE